MAVEPSDIWLGVRAGVLFGVACVTAFWTLIVGWFAVVERVGPGVWMASYFMVFVLLAGPPLVCLSVAVGVAAGRRSRSARAGASVRG
jgi:hypothetical protein